MLRFKRKGEPAEQPAVLPADLLEAIEAATIYSRHDGEISRVIIQPAQMAGWIHSQEADARALKTAWPELTDAQLVRASRFIASRIASHLRRMDDGGDQKRNWVRNW